MAFEFHSVEEELKKHLPSESLEEVTRVLYGKALKLAHLSGNCNSHRDETVLYNL